LQRKKKQEIQPIEELQLSIDALGTIVNTDLPRLQAALTQLDKKTDSITASLSRQVLELKEQASCSKDIDAKLDLLLGKIDLLDKRLSELSSSLLAQ
jgi:hypothetical protein